jgi:hypothetical protein
MTRLMVTPAKRTNPADLFPCPNFIHIRRTSLLLTDQRWHGLGKADAPDGPGHSR